MCGTWLAENTGHKNRHLHTIAQLCQAVFATKACIDNRKTNLLNSNIFSTCPHNMVNFGPLTAEIDWRVWCIPANFNGLHVLASLLHRRHSTEVSQTLHDVWSSLGLVHSVYSFWGLLPPNGILPGAMHPSLAFSCIGNLAALLHSTRSGRQRNIVAWDNKGNYGTFAPHLRHLYCAGQSSHCASDHILV